MLTTDSQPNYKTSAKQRIVTSITIFEIMIRNAQHVWINKHKHTLPFQKVLEQRSINQKMLNWSQQYQSMHLLKTHQW